MSEVRIEDLDEDVSDEDPDKDLNKDLIQGRVSLVSCSLAGAVIRG